MTARRRTPRRHRVIRVAGGRVAYTNTSRIPDADVERVIRFVHARCSLDRVVVHVKRHGRARRWGMAYDGIPSITNLVGLREREWSYLIVVSDGAPSFVELLAHEAKHVEYYRDGLQAGERRCNAFGAFVHREYARAFEHVRRAASVPPAPRRPNPGEADELAGDARALAAKLQAVGMGEWCAALDDLYDELHRIANQGVDPDGTADPLDAA